MSLRTIAAADRRRMNADPMGPAEAVVYQSATGDAVTIRAVWEEFPNEARAPYGIGVQAQVSGAVVHVAEADVPGLTGKATFRRVATNELWEIGEGMELTTGTGWRIPLKRAAPASPRGLR